MSILETIVTYKQKEVERRKELISIEKLQFYTYFARDTYSLKQFLLDQDKTGIIAEFKRKSPSKGIINDSAQIEEVTIGYTNTGASALSVLTDSNFFGGSVEDLIKVRKINQIPILRKEFIIDEYQVYEAKANGADAILLIASLLEKREAKQLAKLAHDMKLQVLMEFHNENDLDILNQDTDIAGINNRNLKTLEVNLNRSIDLAIKIPDGFLKISESGITSPEDVLLLRQYGYTGFLIGEQFMKSPDPVLAFANFVDSLKNKGYDR